MDNLREFIPCSVKRKVPSLRLDGFHFDDWDMLDEMFLLLHLEADLLLGIHVCLPKVMALIKFIEDKTVSLKTFCEFTRLKKRFFKAQADKNARDSLLANEVFIQDLECCWVFQPSY